MLYNVQTPNNSYLHLQDELFHYKKENERLKTVIAIAKYVIIVDILGLVISMFLLVK